MSNDRSIPISALRNDAPSSSRSEKHKIIRYDIKRFAYKTYWCKIQLLLLVKSWLLWAICLTLPDINVTIPEGDAASLLVRRLGSKMVWCCVTRRCTEALDTYSLVANKQRSKYVFMFSETIPRLGIRYLSFESMTLDTSWILSSVFVVIDSFIMFINCEAVIVISVTANAMVLMCCGVVKLGELFVGRCCLKRETLLVKMIRVYNDKQWLLAKMWVFFFLRVLHFGNILKYNGWFP